MVFQIPQHSLKQYILIKKHPENIQMSGICPHLQGEAMCFVLYFLPSDCAFPITTPTLYFSYRWNFEKTQDGSLSLSNHSIGSPLLLWLKSVVPLDKQYEVIIKLKEQSHASEFRVPLKQSYKLLQSLCCLFQVSPFKRFQDIPALMNHLSLTTFCLSIPQYEIMFPFSVVDIVVA